MKSVTTKQCDAYIENMVDEILGRAWCEKQLADYAQFSKNESPPGLWSHRLPHVSPIIPMLYHYYHPDKPNNKQAPIGYWYGDPNRLLRDFAAGVYYFEKYWKALPNGIGVSNIKFRIEHADYFNGFLFELMVAIGYSSNDLTSVEPLLFDPRTTKGGADILITEHGQTIGIQCKSRNPFSAAHISFETTQYIFGCFYRAVVDSGRSYKLNIYVKDVISESDVEEIIKTVKAGVNGGLKLPSATTPSYNVILSPVRIPPRGFTASDINTFVARDRGNLYSEAGACSSVAAAGVFSKFALISISSRHPQRVEDILFKTIQTAAGQAAIGYPLIIAVHFYATLALERYMIDPVLSARLRLLIDKVLKSYPNVKKVKISSNRQEYANDAQGAILLQTQYLEVDNRYFK